MDGSAKLVGSLEILSWKVSGMDCGACVAKVEKAVRRLPGISDVQVNLMSETMTLGRTQDGASADVVERQVAALGYRVSRAISPTSPLSVLADGCGGGCCVHSDHSDHEHGAESVAHAQSHDEPAADVPWWRTGKARLVGVLAVLVGLAWALSLAFPREAYWIFLVATVVAVVPFGRRAVALARAGTPFSIETLMCVAALGAVAIGAAEEAATVVLLFALGEMLENVAAGRARAGIRALAGLIPERRVAKAWAVRSRRWQPIAWPLATWSRCALATACRATGKSWRAHQPWTRVQ